MSVTIDTDPAGHIWRLVDGIPAEKLLLAAPGDDAIHGLTRYGDAYPGERWDTPGAVIRPENVPRLYLAPAPVVEEVPPPRAHRHRGLCMPAAVETPTASDASEDHA